MLDAFHVGALPGPDPRSAHPASGGATPGRCSRSVTVRWRHRRRRMIPVLLAVAAAAFAVHCALAYLAAGQLGYAAAGVIVAGLAVRAGWQMAFPGRGLPRNRVRTMRRRVRLGLRARPGPPPRFRCRRRWGPVAALRPSPP